MHDFYRGWRLFWTSFSDLSLPALSGFLVAIVVFYALSGFAQSIVVQLW